MDIDDCTDLRRPYRAWLLVVREPRPALAGARLTWADIIFGPLALPEGAACFRASALRDGGGRSNYKASTDKRRARRYGLSTKFHPLGPELVAEGQPSTSPSRRRHYSESPIHNQPTPSNPPGNYQNA